MIEVYKSQVKEVVKPSDGVMESYKKLFKRNQTKWMRRSKMEVSHLGQEFTFDEKIYILEGSIDSQTMIAMEKETGKYYRLHCDLIDIAFGLITK
jgi:hypothetical protein